MNNPFDRIITIMFENQYRNYVIQNPFLKKLTCAGADMTNYFGVFHPSQTNYLASFAGEVCGITNDTAPSSPLMHGTLVDLLEAKNISWKAYMEGYPGDPWNPAWSNPDYPSSKQPIAEYPPSGAKELSRYYRKHNAFASFHNVQKDRARWKKIVGDPQFWEDVATGNLPQYSWFTPDIWNDGHYLYNTHIDTDPRTQLVPQIATWLDYVFFGDIESGSLQGGSTTGLAKLGLNLDIDLLLTDPQSTWRKSNVPKGTLIVVSFDESDFDATGYDTNYDGPNQIYTVLLGDMIAPGTVISTPFNHYSLIRTVEQNFQLSSLGKNDASANWFRFLWNESFAWRAVVDSKIKAGKTLAAAVVGDETMVVFADGAGTLFSAELTGSGCTVPREVGVFTRGPIALAADGGQAVLVYTGNNGELFVATRDIQTGWSDGKSLEHKSFGSIALTAYYDLANSTSKFMLCWRSKNGFILSLQGDVSGFSENVIAVNQLTDGGMTLGQLGPSLFLVYKERNTRNLRMTSYNLAPFNAFDAVTFAGKPDPVNNTTLHQWSVSDFAVGNFGRKMSALANEYQNLGQMGMATISGEMHLVHHGGYKDLPHAYTEMFGLTGIYSASSQLSNGFGTLNQAGWTLEQGMTDVNLDLDSPISMTSNDEKLTLVWADSTTNTIWYRTAGYNAN